MKSRRTSAAPLSQRTSCDSAVTSRMPLSFTLTLTSSWSASSLASAPGAVPVGAACPALCCWAPACIAAVVMLYGEADAQALQRTEESFAGPRLHMLLLKHGYSWSDRITATSRRAPELAGSRLGIEQAQLS